MAEERVYSIYLIDSDVIYRTMVRKYLELKTIYIPDFKYKLFTFESAELFLSALNSYPQPDFIFTDIEFQTDENEDLQENAHRVKLKHNCPIYLVSDQKKTEILNMTENETNEVLLKEMGRIDQMVQSIKKDLNLKNPI